MFTRWITLALLILALAPVAVLGAQTDQTSAVHCGDLAASDCQILQDNKAAMDAVSSFMFDMTMTMDLDYSRAGDEGFALSLSLAGGGGIAVNPDMLADMLALEAELENAPGMALSAETIAQIDAFIGGLTGEVSAAIQLIADGEQSDIDLHMLMRDGVFAISAGTLAGLMDQPMDGMDWIGLDANGLLSLLASDPDTADWLGMGAGEAAYGDSNWAEIEAAATTITRLANSEVKGVEVAVFESVVTMSQLADLLLGATGEAYDLDEAERAAMLQQLEIATLSMRQYIGAGDHYTYRTELAMDMGGAANATSELGAVEMSMAMTLDTSGFNAPVEVAIPEDAFILPLAMLMQMGS